MTATASATAALKVLTSRGHGMTVVRRMFAEHGHYVGTCKASNGRTRYTFNGKALTCVGLMAEALGRGYFKP